jgi:hypothetical protein
MWGTLRCTDVAIYVQIDRYLLIEAARLEILAEMAAAKGHKTLAEDIRRCRRILIDAVPLKPASSSGADAPDGKVRGFSL